MLSTLLHVAAGFCGLAFGAMALFLTEDEQGKIQNRLEQLWVRVDDLSKGAMTREAALIQQASKMLMNTLNSVFGERLWSMKAVATSTGVSTASVFAVMYIIGAGSYGTLALAVVGLLLCAAPGKLRYGTFLTIPTLAIWLFVRMSTFYADSYFRVPNYVAIFTQNVIFGTIVGGTGSDILLIVFIRWLLEKSAMLSSSWKLMAILLLQLSMGVALISPIYLAGEYRPIVGAWHWALQSMTFGLGASNLLAALACFLAALLLLAALLRHLMWPVLSRPVYALQRFGVIRHPKLLAALSASCVLFAWPHSPVVAALAKILHLPGN